MRYAIKKHMRTFLRPWLLGLLVSVAVGARGADSAVTSAADGDASADIAIERDSEITFATDETGKVVKVVRRGNDTIDMATFAEAFEIVDTLVLEETDAAMVVAPMVTADGSGLLVLAEPSEAQVNVYGTDGSLEAVYGGRGDGPGEMAAPIDASRTRDGEIVVADVLQNSLTFYKPDSDDQPEEFLVPLEGVVGVQDMGGGRYLLASLFPAPLLHVWNRGTGEVERSFFEPGVSARAQGLVGSMGTAMPAIAGDTIWAVWTLADTLYRFSGDGEHVSSAPLSLARPVGELPARPPSSPLELQELTDRITQLAKVFVLGSGEKVVVSMQTRGFEAVWDLLIVDAQGETVWKAANMPRLLTVDGDLFYFLAEPVRPGRWLVARRRADA